MFFQLKSNKSIEAKILITLSIRPDNENFVTLIPTSCFPPTFDPSKSISSKFFARIKAIGWWKNNYSMLSKNNNQPKKNLAVFKYLLAKCWHSKKKKVPEALFTVGKKGQKLWKGKIWIYAFHFFKFCLEEFDLFWLESPFFSTTVDRFWNSSKFCTYFSVFVFWSNS